MRTVYSRSTKAYILSPWRWTFSFRRHLMDVSCFGIYPSPVWMYVRACVHVCVCVSVYMCVGASPQRSKSKDSAEENVSTKGCGLYVSCALQRANNVTRVRSINNIYFSFKYLYTNTHHFCSRTSRLSMKDKKIYTRYTILCVQ